MAREIADLPALEAARRKKAADAMKCRALMSTRAERELMAVAIAYTDAADMVAAMMREGNGEGF